VKYGKNLIKTFVWILTLLHGLLLAISNFALVIDPATWAFPQFLGLAFPILFFLNLLALFFWLAALNIRIIFPGIILLTSLLHVSKYLQFTAQRIPDPEANVFKVGSLNTKLFGHWEGREFIDTALFNIRMANFDIVCMQEAYIMGENKDSLLSTVLINTKFNDFNYTRLNPGKPYGMILLTKHKILKAMEIELPNTTANMVMYYDLLINSDTIRLYNVHLQSIRFKPADYTFMDGQDNDSSMLKSHNIYKQMAMAYETRVKQARKIKEHINNSPYPVVLCGDLNDVPMSYTYQLLIESPQRLDAFREAGNGLESTYQGLFPSFRIDYIFTSKDIYTLQYSSSGDIPSDHKLVSATLQYKKN
jgi:endonuclease/exonuclease/phosphatase family metal-dependent hydrolase